MAYCCKRAVCKNRGYLKDINSKYEFRWSVLCSSCGNTNQMWHPNLYCSVSIYKYRAAVSYFIIFVQFIAGSIDFLQICIWLARSFRHEKIFPFHRTIPTMNKRYFCTVKHVFSLLGGELKVILDFCLNFTSSYTFFRFIFVIAWYTKDFLLFRRDV